MSLTTCMKKAGDAISAADKKAILSRAAVLRKEGLKANEAATKAVDELIAKVGAEIDAMGGAPEPAADEPATLKERVEAKKPPAEPTLKQRVEKRKPKVEAKPDAEEAPVASRAESTTGTDASTLRAEIASITAKWKNGPAGGVHVVQSAEQLPANVLRSARESDPDGVARAWFDPRNESVYLIADRLQSLDDAKEALFHESYGHLGMRSILGDNYAPAMMRLRAANPHLASEASMWFARYGRDEIKARMDRGATREQAEREVRLLSTEEALADRAGLNEPLRGWDRFMSAVQKALRAIGLDNVANWLETKTEAETRAFLARAREAVTNGEPNVGGALAPAASRAQPDAVASRPLQPEWVSAGGAAIQSAAGKIDTYAPTKPIADKVREMSAGWKEKIVQGMFDSYAPLRKLSMDAYIAARMTKSADGAFEGMLLYGKPKMDADNAITGELDGKGFLGVMQELNGEHDRFFMWLAGNRAQRLKGEGRENLFSDTEITAMTKLNAGKMADGSSREAAYLKAQQQFGAYNKSVMDIAERTGLIDGEAREFWEHDFYVPFHRVMEDGEIAGPGRIKGLVRQKAFDRLKGGKENLGDLMDNALRNWSHLLGASLANQAASKSLLAAEQAGVALEAKEDTAKDIAKAIGKKGGAVYFMDKGAPRWFVVDDPAVLAAITSMEAVGLSGIPMKVMGKFKQYLTMGVTIAPAFKVRNLIRDTLAAPAVNEMSFNVAKNLAEGWKGTKKGSDQYAQMLFGGAMMRFGTYLEGDRAEHVKRLIDAGVKDDTILDTSDKIKAAGTKLWDAWQNFGDRLENVNRAALYEQLLKSGKSHREAAFQARDMMDFSLQGSWAAMRVLTQVVPFLNARAQGLYKLGRGAKENPKRFGYVVGAVALSSIALMLANQDDEDWKEREDWDRDMFWWFKIGDTAYRIPKPFEVGALGTIAERSVELMVSDEMTGGRFAERMKTMLLDTFSMNPVPQLFKPMVDLYANKDSFTGRAIETRGMENQSKSERYGPNTSALAKALGAGGDVTGISPVQVDHMIRAYFGWLGTMAATTIDVAVSPLSDAEKPSPKLDHFTSGFVKELPSQSSRYLTEFYEQAKAVSEVMADIRAARDAGDMEKAAQIAEDERDKTLKARVYQRAERRLGQFGSEIRRTMSSVSMSADEKRARIDELVVQRNNLARETVRTQMGRE